jgi:hypothetical protein
MADAPKPPDATRLLHELQQSDELRHQVAVGTELDPHLTLLRAWQSERLAQTYADLLADRQFRSAYLFFLSDIYAPRDFSQRDYDFQRIHNFLSPVVPPQMLQVLTDAIELNSLTNDLDNQLVQIRGQAWYDRHNLPAPLRRRLPAVRQSRPASTPD